MYFKKLIKRTLIFLTLLLIIGTQVMAEPKSNGKKVKFYNFDDLLINGEYKKPQVLYTDSRQKVRFERLLKLKKDFLPKLLNTRQDPALK